MTVHRLPPGHGVPVLGQQQQIAVTEQRIVAPAAVALFENGLTIEGCNHHLLVVDVAKQTAWRVPVTRGTLETIGGAAVRFLTDQPEISGVNDGGPAVHE